MSSTIVVAEDEPGYMRVLRKFLVPEGYTVLEAKTGTEALRLLKSRPVEILIADILMPELDGIELCTKVKLTLPDMKIICMSNGGEVLGVDRVVTLCENFCDAFLQKPFAREVLLDAVRKLLDQEGVDLA